MQGIDSFLSNWKNSLKLLCQIINMQPHHLCSSIHLKQPNTLQVVDSTGAELASLLGLPVITGCTIMVDGKRPVVIRFANNKSVSLFTYRLYVFNYSRLSSGNMTMGVVASSTILLRSIPTHSVGGNESKTGTSQQKPQDRETFSNIRVVQDLIERVVYPAAYLPTFVQYKGNDCV